MATLEPALGEQTNKQTPTKRVVDIVLLFIDLQPFSVACGISLNEFWMWRMSESGK